MFGHPVALGILELTLKEKLKTLCLMWEDTQNMLKNVMKFLKMIMKDLY